MNMIERSDAREKRRDRRPDEKQKKKVVRRLKPDERVLSKAIARAGADVLAIEDMKGGSARKAAAAVIAFNMIDSAAYRAAVRKLTPALEPELRRAGIAAVISRHATAPAESQGENNAQDDMPSQESLAMPTEVAKHDWRNTMWAEHDDTHRMLRDLEKFVRIHVPSRESRSENGVQTAAEAHSEAGLVLAPTGIAPPSENSPKTADHDGLPLDAAGTRQPQQGKLTLPDREEESGDIPLHLRKRYLIAENKFYFRGQEGLLAFEDEGKRLRTEHDDPAVAKSMVDLAIAKNWSAIKVKGTADFKREVWLSASLRGIDVAGYEPRPLDMSKLEELLADRNTAARNVIEHDAQRDLNTPAGPLSKSAPKDARQRFHDERQANLSDQETRVTETLEAILRGRGDSDVAVKMAKTHAAGRFQESRAYVGKLIKHGVAPYLYDKENDESYFIKLKTATGERTVWGVDLQRAVEKGGGKKGDAVAITLQGWKPVTFEVGERGENGKTTYTERQVMRATWTVSQLDKLSDRERARVTALARQTRERQPSIPVGSGRNKAETSERSARPLAKHNRPERTR